jgi:hypothetical protein
MTNPTSNFGWVMPTTTDLVTDLPADFAVFGQAVDTSMADLKGGTTGQSLTKASNTDMDFTWATSSGGTMQQTTFTSTNATWAIPAGVTKIEALVVSGGGGGGGTNATASNYGGGGGGGGYVCKFITLSGDTTLNIVVGAGGAGGATSGSGSAGGTSSITGNQSSTVYATIGGGGFGGAAGGTAGGTGASGGGRGTVSYSYCGGGGASFYPTNESIRFGYDTTSFSGLPTIRGVTGYPGGGYSGAGGSDGFNYYGGLGITVFDQKICGGGNAIVGYESYGTNFGAGGNASKNATANTGGGGGAGVPGSTTTGGNGGSGLVIIRYIGA